MRASKQGLVSIIIPTLNSARFLELCLNSVEWQTYPEIEVIISDDGSSDSTLEIATRHGCKLVRNPRRGRAAAKNEGIEHSSGEYLFFVDSDMELTRGLVDECVTMMEADPHIAGIVVPERSSGKSLWVRARDLERRIYCKTAVESARFFRRAALGGLRFDEDLIFFEEATLPYKISHRGFRVTDRSKSEIIHHEEGFSISKWIRKKYSYGKTLSAYKRRYPDLAAIQIGPGKRLTIFAQNWRRLSREPLAATGILALKCLEAFAVALGEISP